MATVQARRTKRPGIWVRIGMGLFLIPLGIVIRVMSQIYLEITPDAVHFVGVMGFVIVATLGLLSISLMAAMNFRRRPVLVLIAVQVWIGYGIGTALLALKDMD